MSINSDYYAYKKKKEEEEEEKRKKGLSADRFADLAPIGSYGEEQAYTDVAPVAEERTWFQTPEAFKDLWENRPANTVVNPIGGTSAPSLGEILSDMGGIVKAIDKTFAGTEMDLRAGLLSGILGIGEAVVDTGAFLAGGVGSLFGADEFADKMKDFVDKDLYDERAIAEQIVKHTSANWLANIVTGEDDNFDDSILGAKSDSLAASGGQLLATAGLQAVGVPWFVTTGVTSFGSGVEEAFSEDATYLEAGGSALVSAGAEILSEKLFGGIKFGGKTLDDVLVKPLVDKIANKTVRTLVNLGVDTVGEGAEEVFSQVFSNLGSALYKEESIDELLLSEQAMDGYLESLIGGMVLGGVSSGSKAVNSMVQGTDYKTGLTDNETKVFEQEYADRIKEAEEGGKKLTAKQKNKIYDAVMNDLKKGYISTDKIESVLGGENVNVQELLQGDRKGQGSLLFESYNENTRKGQAFQADTSKYDAKQAEIVQKAIDSGVLNNTNRSHELVDMIAKIAAEKGVGFDFTNNAKLKESGFAVDGKQVNGFVTKDGITLNINSQKLLNSVVGHEISHVLEGTEIYAELQNALFDYAKGKGDYQGRYDALAKLYEGVEGANIEAELTADLVGDYLFTDADFVSHLSTKHRNVFQKIYDEIKYLWKSATAGSKEARELEKVKRTFEKVYRESGKTSADTKYSISDSGTSLYETFLRELNAVQDRVPSEGVREQAEYNGKDFWLAVADLNGNIVKTWTYAEAESAQFDVEAEILFKKELKDGYRFFTTDLIEDNGRIEFDDYGEPLPDNMVDRINEQIKVKPARKAVPDVALDALREHLDENRRVSDSGSRYNDVRSWIEGEGVSDVAEDLLLEYVWEYDSSSPVHQWLDTIKESGLGELDVRRKVESLVGEAFNVSKTQTDARYSLSDEAQKIDNDYLDAVNRGDTKKAQKMVDDVASTMMPDSKIRTEDGKLRIVYHGTNTGDFTVFNPDYIGMSSGDDGFFGMGFYFAYSKGEASYYGSSRVIPAYLNLKKPFNFEKELQTYNGKRASGGYAPDAVALMNFADKFPDIAKNVKIGVVENGSDTGKDITLVEFSKAFKDVIENKTFEYSVVANEFGEKETVVTADAKTVEYEYDGKKHSYKDYGFQKRFWGTPNELDVAYEYLANSVYEYVDMIPRTRLILDNNREFTAALKDMGYDGAIQSEHGDEAVAFYPNQIFSADPVTYDDDGNVIPLSQRFNVENNDIRYSLSEDSEGRPLSDEQKKYFNGSKVVDSNGNLSVVYHGSGAEFTEFSYDFMSTHGSMEGQGFYFTDSKTMAEGYQRNGAKLMEGYLAIKKPLSDSKKTLSRAEVTKLMKAIDPTGDDVVINYDPLGGLGYPSKTWYNRALSATVDNLMEYCDTDSEILADIANSGAGTETVVRKAREVLGYDGYIVRGKYDGANIYVAFESNQFKNIDNQNPTDNPDIRHSLSDDGEMPRYYGDLRIRGEDVAYTAEDIAPVGDSVAPVQSNVAPSSLYNKREGEDGWGTEYSTASDALYAAAKIVDAELWSDYMEEVDRSPAYISPDSRQIIHGSMPIDDAFSNIIDAVRQETISPMQGAALISKAYKEGGIPGLKNVPHSQHTDVMVKYAKEAELWYEHRGEQSIVAEAPLAEEIEDQQATAEEETSRLDKKLARIDARLKQDEASLMQEFQQRKAELQQATVDKNAFISQRADELYWELSSLKKGVKASAELGYLLDYGYKWSDIKTALVNTKLHPEARVNQDSVMESVVRDYLNKEYEDRVYEIGDLDTEYQAQVKELRTEAEKARKDARKEEQGPKTASVLETEPETAKRKNRAWAMFKASFLDKGAVFEDLSLKENNRELMGKWNYTLSSEARAQHFMGNGADGVKPLSAIRNEVGSTGKETQFYEYMYHKHNIDRMNLAERYEQGKNKPVFGETVTADVSKEAVRKYEAENPEFKEYAEDVYAYMGYLRKQLVDSGVISQETADLWAEMYPHYVPIRRAGDKGLNISVPLDTRRTGVNAPVKQATGGDSDILPLFDTVALRTEQTYKAIARNNFGIELKNTLGTTVGTEATNLDEAIDSIDTQEELLKKSEKGRSPTFTVFENGKKVTFEITEDMYDALKPTSEGLLYTNKVANTITKAHRGLLTEYNPVFMLTNAVKDAQDVLLNSQHAAKTYANLPKAYAELATKGRWYKEYMENGGEQNTYFDGKTNTFTEEKKGIAKWLGAISVANNFVERAPRLAEYIASRESGASVEVAMLDAARVTTNFAAGGDVTKFLNRNGATFLNASVQGAMQQVRNVREAKAKGLKGVMGLVAKTSAIGLSAILLNHLLWDDDEDYEDLSDYVKQNYYVVAKYGDGQFVRIPKGRAIAVIQEAFAQMENLVTGNDEADLNSFLDLVINNLAPNNPVEDNILAPIIQVANNETWYGDDLVPTRLQDLPASEQYDESTDSISKWLGEKIEFSPYKINYLLNQYSGGLGDVVLPMLTPEAESGDNSLVGNLLAPLKSKFTTDSVMNNQNVSDFYDTRDELAKNANSVNATAEDKLMYKYINSVNTELGELYKQKREAQNSDLADDEKYAAVRDIQAQINALTEESLASYKDIYINGDYAMVGDRHYKLNSNGEWQKVSEDKMERDEAMASVFGGYNAYKGYSSTLGNIKADEENTRKENVVKWLNSLDVDYGMKMILFRSQYKKDNTYNAEIVEYLNSRDDISYEEMVSILTELGFTVNGNNVTWD